MRRLLSLVVLLILAAAPALAERTMTGRGFGRAYCNKAFPCPETLQGGMEMNYLSLLTNEGHTCVRTYLGKTAPNGFFETTFPDGAGCLVMKYDPDTQKTDGPALIPQCCIKPSPKAQGLCILVCTLQEAR